ncbi:MAG TPA: GNAT family N-acetyltransferase [Gaiellaceae bacterium]|nr:GNAT family N-acetyltransferase [Gaiellaceae bacterium]
MRTWQAAYEHLFGAERLAGLDVERRRAGWERTIREDGGVLVAERDGRVVGFASVGADRQDARRGELYAIYVLPDAWGGGAGPALLAEATRALAASFPEAVLWVLEDNPRARRFYERAGWAPDGTRRDEEFLGVATGEVRYRITLG